MSLRGWEKLTCGNMVVGQPGLMIPCGCENFVAAYKLTWHEGQGTASKQDSWVCAKCGAIASTAKMIEVVQKKHLQDQIKELEARQSG